jgi:predicted membrane-bound mannosyltransferase
MSNIGLIFPASLQTRVPWATHRRLLPLELIRRTGIAPTKMEAARLKYLP